MLFYARFSALTRQRGGSRKLFLSLKSPKTMKIKLPALRPLLSSALLLLTLLGVGLLPSNADTLWSAEYQGYELLQSPWSAVQKTRMETSPGEETWLQINGSLGDTYVEIKNPTFAPEINSTLEFTLNIVKAGTQGRWSQGVMVFVAGYAWEIRIDTNRISLAGATTKEYTSDIGLNQEHHYRLVIEAGTASLYFDHGPEPIFSDLAGNTGFPTLSQVLRIGDYGGNLTGDGRWDNIRWHNTQALPIPEPATTALLFGIGSLLLACHLKYSGKKRTPRPSSII